MDVYKLEKRWELSLRLTYRRCRFWQKKVIVLDEAHFDLGGYVNKQNCCLWGTENPHKYIEKRVTVWCGFWSRGIIGPFFFENEQGKAITVNGDRYWAMLNEFLFTWNWKKEFRQHLVSTGRLYVPHSRSYTRCVAPCFWRSQLCAWYRLATSELRY